MVIVEFLPLIVVVAYGAYIYLTRPRPNCGKVRKQEQARKE